MKKITFLLDMKNDGTLTKRLAMLLAVLAVPAIAAPGDFGAVAGDAPLESENLSRELAAMPAMPFERPGMTFPGSAFFYLADPVDGALVALPATDALGKAEGYAGALGKVIDAGPAARPFFSAPGGVSHSRALECLSQAIWYEAASESDAGQRAVAQVVLNRVAHPSWPGSVCGVVYQGSQRKTGCQFTFTCDGSLSRRAGGASWRRAQKIASDALSGSVYAPIGLATHYHTLWVNPAWAGSLDHVGTIGAHRFYRKRGSGGQSAAFSTSYAGLEPGVSNSASPAATAAQAPTGTPRISYDVPVAASAAPVAIEPGTARPRTGGIGQVKAEYAKAGQWKARPNDPETDAGEKAPKPADE
ncbi:cell wall hydrolase [Erythrobacter sp. THAF29]|uniref:cell wall hydrolase n=1 Tax=Erythrobacter sp. THAF29 TaxID=2587851 RepID=UPI0012A9B7CE|nr:cell wall hydrolase [Erythrobacter sp. THAF29]QFT78233.1 Spore cortex-lytic enzyme precursor [Erythrobacter sp. THAF29]